MKINAVISKPGNNLISRVRQTDLSLIMSSAIMVSGIISGSLLYIVNAGNNQEISIRFTEFFTVFCNGAKKDIFIGLIISLLPYYLIMTAGGLCVFGTPAVIAATFLRCSATGFLATYIYSSFALKGIEYCLLVFFPGRVFEMFAVLLMTKSAVSMSGNILRLIKGKERKIEISRYFIKAALVFLCLILSAVIHFICIISFSKLFSFT